MEALLVHLNKEKGSTVTPGMLLMVNAPDGTIAYASLPKFWETYPPIHIPQKMEGQTGKWVLVRGSGWFGDASKIDESDWLEITSKNLSQGYTLFIGYSNEEIEETQSRLSGVFFNLLGFSLAVGVLGGIFPLLANPSSVKGTGFRHRACGNRGDGCTGDPQGHRG